MIPCLLNGFAAIDSDVKHHHGHPVLRASITGPGLAIYRGPRGPSIVKAQSSPSLSRRAITASPRKPPRDELPCAVPKPEPFDHFARPLPVERGGVHHHDAAVPRPPRNRNDYPVPECKNASLVRRIGPLGMLPAQNFVAQRRSQRANYAVHRGSNYRNLYAARPFQLRQPRVVMNVHRFRRIRFLRALRALVR